MKQGDSRSKSSKKKQGMTEHPFPNNCGKGSNNPKKPEGDHQWGSKVGKKAF